MGNDDSSGMEGRMALAIVVVLIAGASAGAQPQPIDCAKAVTTPELAHCAAEDLKTADAALAATLKAAIDKAGAATHLGTNQRRDWQRALREAHRHWLAFRDKDCGEVTGWEWFQGTGMGTASLTCKAAKTRQRTEELRTRYGS